MLLLLLLLLLLLIGLIDYENELLANATVHLKRPVSIIYELGYIQKL